jgi:hypothetical protein
LNQEFPTILAVLRLEITGPDAKRQPPPADQIDTGGDLGDMRGIAVADRCGRSENMLAAPLLLGLQLDYCWVSNSTVRSLSE